MRGLFSGWQLLIQNGRTAAAGAGSISARMEDPLSNRLCSNQWHGVTVESFGMDEPMCSLTRSKAVLRVADGKLGFYTWQFDTGASLRNWHQLKRSTSVVPGFGSLFSIPALSPVYTPHQRTFPHTTVVASHPDSLPLVGLSLCTCVRPLVIPARSLPKILGAMSVDRTRRVQCSLGLGGCVVQHGTGPGISQEALSLFDSIFY